MREENMKPDLRRRRPYCFGASIRVNPHGVGIGPKCVMDIQELLDIKQANVSQHLTALRHARIVDYHEDGKLRCYYVARPGLVKVLRRLVERLFRLWIVQDGGSPRSITAELRPRRSSAKK
jgi:DNA-binding transcriptional ArsR family regulator